jgi:hypothetical protein
VTFKINHRKNLDVSFSFWLMYIKCFKTFGQPSYFSFCYHHCHLNYTPILQSKVSSLLRKRKVKSLSVNSTYHTVGASLVLWNGMRNCICTIPVTTRSIKCYARFWISTEVISEVMLMKQL